MLEKKNRLVENYFFEFFGKKKFFSKKILALREGIFML